MRLNNQEISYVYSMHGHNILSTDIGTNNEIVLSKETMNYLKKAPKESIGLIHVHPSNTPLSEADVQKLSYDSLKFISVELPNGKKYIMINQKKNGRKVY